MKRKDIHFSYHFPAQEIRAVMAATPLIFYEEANTEAQAMINYQLAASLGKKIESGDSSLSPNELRIMYIVVDLAMNALSADPWFDYDSEDIGAVRPYFFEYNHLKQVLEPVMDSLMNN